MKTLVPALLLRGGCTEMKDGIEGTQSLQVQLISPANGGSSTQRLMDSQRALTIDVTALGPDGEVDTSFDRDVQVYAQFLGTLTPSLSDPPLTSFRVTGGKATGKAVMLPAAYGPTTLWIDDGKSPEPTFATGTSPTLWYRDPFIVDLQTPRSETALGKRETAERMESGSSESIRNRRRGPKSGRGASKHGQIGNDSVQVEKSLKTAEIGSAAEHYQDRAAIIEFDGRLPRVTAEAMARREVSERWGKDVAKEATK